MSIDIHIHTEIHLMDRTVEAMRRKVGTMKKENFSLLSGILNGIVIVHFAVSLRILLIYSHLFLNFWEK